MDMRDAEEEKRKKKKGGDDDSASSWVVKFEWEEKWYRGL